MFVLPLAPGSLALSQVALELELVEAEPLYKVTHFPDTWDLWLVSYPLQPYPSSFLLL